MTLGRSAAEADGHQQGQQEEACETSRHVHPHLFESDFWAWRRASVAGIGASTEARQACNLSFSSAAFSGRSLDRSLRSPGSSTRL